MDDDTYRRARIKAAEAGRSLSAIVRDCIERIGNAESEFERLKRQEHELRARMDAEGIGLIASENLSRNEIYDRRRDR